MIALKSVYTILKSHQKLQDFISLVSHVSEKFKESTPQVFTQSKEYIFICKEFQKIQISGLIQAFENLPQIPEITAVILKTSKLMTLAFIMLPKNKPFKWHDHTGINGMTKVVCGQIQITAIKQKDMKAGQEDEKTFQIPRTQMRKQILEGKEGKVSYISPDSFNIHTIKAIQRQGGFLDLLIPEYLDDDCHYFEEIEVEGKPDLLFLRKLENSTQTIIGLEQLVELLKK